MEGKEISTDYDDNGGDDDDIDIKMMMTNMMMPLRQMMMNSAKIMMTMTMTSPVQNVFLSTFCKHQHQSDYQVLLENEHLLVQRGLRVL